MPPSIKNEYTSNLLKHNETFSFNLNIFSIDQDFCGCKDFFLLCFGLHHLLGKKESGLDFGVYIESVTSVKV